MKTVQTHSPGHQAMKAAARVRANALRDEALDGARDAVVRGLRALARNLHLPHPRQHKGV